MFSFLFDLAGNVEDPQGCFFVCLFFSSEADGQDDEGEFFLLCRGEKNPIKSDLQLRTWPCVSSPKDWSGDVHLRWPGSPHTCRRPPPPPVPHRRPPAPGWGSGAAVNT